jgi:hypothetical protein
MTIATSLKPYLGDIDHLTDRSSDGKNDYVHPAFRHLGCVSIVLIREIAAPAVFRNQEAEITQITMESTGHSYVRAVPNKFKHRERANGLKILRHFGAGGAYPQNRNAIPEKTHVSQAFDLNSLVFGDSANQGKRVLPVKAAALYSDGLSLIPYADATDKTFHNRASEDGSLFDAASKENSSNLFERHFVRPGTLMVQVVSTIGRTMPIQGLEHLLLSLGLAGAYGGQTSVTGVNVKTHIAGIYASLIERPETSPYSLVERVDGYDVAKVAAGIHDFLSPLHEVAISMADAHAYRDGLIGEIVSGSERLKTSYAVTKDKVGSLFGDWFTAGKAAA